MLMSQIHTPLSPLRVRASWYRRLLGITALLISLLITGEAVADALTVQVDRQSIRLNETLNLVVRYEGRQVNSDPDFTGLDQFDILSNNKSTQHSIINGNISAFTEWRLTLSPRNTGQLLVPPLSLHGEHSKAITINVAEATKDPISGKEDVFLETFVDKSTVFVQEQFIITYRLHFNQSVDSLDTGQFNIPQARVEELPRVDYQTTVGHTAYGVAEFRYAVSADASGIINIPERTWTIRTTDQPGMNRFGFGGGRFKLHRVKTKALAITVEPKPAEFPASQPWLPAQAVYLEEQWSRSPDEFRVGEPITRTVTIRAEGASPEQLPPLFDGRGTQDLKFYPDKPDQDKQLTAQGVKAMRRESVAIVPSRAGDITLPEVSVAWWNTEEKRLEKATLPARILHVAAAEGQPQATVEREAVLPASDAISPAQALPASTATTSGVWPWISGALLLCNLLTLLLLWRQTKRQNRRQAEAATPAESPANLKAALRRLRQTCERRDAAATRLALLEWAEVRWGGRQRLQDIANATSADVQRELNKLDGVLFAGAENDVDYALLTRTAEQLSQTVGGNRAGPELPALYKTG
jgi:hypothetical protein